MPPMPARAWVRARRTSPTSTQETVSSAASAAFVQVDGLLLFASEIKALLQHPSVPRRADLVGLDQILSNRNG